MSRIILWLRNDLRMLDNYAMSWAVNSKPKEIIPVYCFDPRTYADRTKYESRKCGLIRARFQIESVLELRKNLKSIGSELLLTNEKPEEFIPKLLAKDMENIIVYQQEICWEELKVEEQVAQQAKKTGFKIKIQPVWGSTVVHQDDMPWDTKTYIPANFTQLKKKLSTTVVRKLVEAPKKGEMPFSKKFVDSGIEFVPNLEDYGYSAEERERPVDKRAVLKFVGGESAGIERVQTYIFKNKSLGHYAKTRNGMIGSEYSSKFACWLANGSISPRYVYWQVREFCKKYSSSESTQSFMDEVYWREWMRWWCLRHGRSVFFQGGIYNRDKSWQADMDIIRRWKEGKTGMPIIDALMREMNTTGFMGNRGRQIVASYLTLDLLQDWRYGAHHFEEVLIDHDVQSNYGSWNKSAGIGPGLTYAFKTTKQSKDFDKEAKFIKMWCPELSNLPIQFTHEPWTMSLAEQKQHGVELGEKYPHPIYCAKYVQPDKQKSKEESKLGFSEAKPRNQRSLDAFLKVAAEPKTTTKANKKRKLSDTEDNTKEEVKQGQIRRNGKKMKK